MGHDHDIGSPALASVAHCTNTKRMRQTILMRGWAAGLALGALWCGLANPAMSQVAIATDNDPEIARLRSCATAVAERQLRGEARRDFMSNCLVNGPPPPARRMPAVEASQLAMPRAASDPLAKAAATPPPEAAMTPRAPRHADAQPGRAARPVAEPQNNASMTVVPAVASAHSPVSIASPMPAPLAQVTPNLPPSQRLSAPAVDTQPATGERALSRPVVMALVAPPSQNDGSRGNAAPAVALTVPNPPPSSPIRSPAGAGMAPAVPAVSQTLEPQPPTATANVAPDAVLPEPPREVANKAVERPPADATGSPAAAIPASGVATEPTSPPPPEGKVLATAAAARQVVPPAPASAGSAALATPPPAADATKLANPPPAPHAAYAPGAAALQAPASMAAPPHGTVGPNSARRPTSQLATAEPPPRHAAPSTEPRRRGTLLSAVAATSYLTEALAREACIDDVVVWGRTDIQRFYPRGSAGYSSARPGAFLCLSAAELAGYQRSQ